MDGESCCQHLGTLASDTHSFLTHAWYTPSTQPSPHHTAPLWIVQQGLCNLRPVKSGKECDPESMGVGATKGTRSSPAVYPLPPEDLRREKVCSKTSLQPSSEATVVVPVQPPTPLCSCPCHFWRHASHCSLVNLTHPPWYTLFLVSVVLLLQAMCWSSHVAHRGRRMFPGESLYELVASMIEYQKLTSRWPGYTRQTICLSPTPR